MTESWFTVVSPRHQLIVSVSLVAAIVVIAWFLLFQSHVLAPPVTMPEGPTLPEIGKQFEERAASLNKLLVPAAVNAAATNASPTMPPASASSGSSDDVRGP